MPSAKVLEVPVGNGMRQDISAHRAPPGTLTYAKNVRFTTDGEVRARSGTTELSSATSADVTYDEVANGEPFIQRLPDSFYVGCAGYGYRFDLDKDRLHVGGSYGNAEPLGIWETMAREEQTLVSGASSPWPLSQVAVNGYVATVQSDGNGQPIGDGTYDVGPGGQQSLILHVRTEDGALAMSAQLQSATGAWLVADGSSSTSIILIYQDTTTGLNARIVSTSATGATLGAAVSVGTLTSATSFWAACYWPAIGWVLAYRSGAGTITLKVLAGTAQTNSTTFLASGNPPLSVYATATHLFVGFVNGAVAPFNSNAYIYDTALANTGSVTLATEAVLQALGPPLFGPSTTGASSAMWALSRSVDERFTDATWLEWGEVTSVGGVPIDQRVYQATAASAPFANGYVWARVGSNVDTHNNRYTRYVLLDFMGMRSGTGAGVSRQGLPVMALVGTPVADVSSNGYPGGFYLQQLSAPTALSDGSYVMGLPRLVRLLLSNGTETGLAISEWLRFSLGGARQTTTLGNSVLVAGVPTLADAGVGTSAYDGTNTFASQRDGVDLGFPYPPGILTPTISNGAGSLTSSATYQWRAVLERIDQDSVRWRSAPSSIVTKTLGASDDTAALTARFSTGLLRAVGGSLADNTGSRFVMHFYRTLANGSTFYRCTPPQGAPTEATGGLFTFTDLISDSTLQFSEILYTDGGVLANDMPPSNRFIRATEDRVWLGGLWETEQLQSSKVLVPGEPPQFSDLGSFRVVLPEPCTGIGIQDGIVVAFCRRAIYAIQGGGPNDQGQGAWESPRCITRSTGCINHRSIVETSAGIFFESERGIELLPRGCGEPVFIGEPVFELAGQLGSSGVISVSVVITSESTTVRFCLGSFYVLIFDLDTKAWSFDQYPAAVAAICDTDEGAILAWAAVTAGGYGFLQEGTNLDTDSLNNATVQIDSTLIWADLRPFGVAGWGKFSEACGAFDALSTGYLAQNCTLFMTVDVPSPTEPGATFLMSDFNRPDYRKVVPRYDAGTAAVLKLTTVGGGWRFLGWTVGIEQVGGVRRGGELEQK